MLYDLRHEHAYFVQWLILHRHIGNWSKHFVKLLSCAMFNSMKKQEKNHWKTYLFAVYNCQYRIRFHSIWFICVEFSFIQCNAMQFTAVRCVIDRRIGNISQYVSFTSVICFRVFFRINGFTLNSSKGAIQWIYLVQKGSFIKILFIQKCVVKTTRSTQKHLNAESNESEKHQCTFEASYLC